MNIAFFLTPKNEVVILRDKWTMRQALEKMEFHRFAAVPIIDDHGRYVGTLTEGDMLWKIKNTPGLSFEGTERIPLTEVPRHNTYDSIRINAEIEDLITLAAAQNFIPVVDDEEHFIGIIRRREIINYCADMLDGRKLKKVMN